MTLNDAALTAMATALPITHLQAYSAAPGAAGTSNPIGSRVAATKSVDADGDITWTNVAFTGLPANSPVHSVGYWSAATGGTYYGAQQITTGDAVANAAGNWTATSLTETGTAT